MKRFTLMLMTLRVWWLEAQIENGEALLANHRARLDACYDEMRRIKSRIATITPASTLLEQALRRKA